MAKNFSEVCDLLLWIVGAILATVVLLSPVACTMHQNAQITAAIAKGVDPIKARCAFESTTDMNAKMICMKAVKE